MLFVLSVLIAMSEATTITLIFGMTPEYEFNDETSVDFERTVPIAVMERAVSINIGFQDIVQPKLYDGFSYPLDSSVYDVYCEPTTEAIPSFCYDSDADAGGEDDIIGSFVYTQDEEYGYLTWNRLLKTEDINTDLQFVRGESYQLIYGYDLINDQGNMSEAGLKHAIDDFTIKLEDDADDQDKLRVFSFLDTYQSI